MTGSSPYDLYFCDGVLQNCFYLETFTTYPITVIVPPPLDVQSSVCVKIVDNLNCVTYTCQTL